MPDDPIPLPVRGFLTEHIDSTAALDLLLLLRDDPSRRWSSTDAAQALRMPVPWAAGQLAMLHATGLLEAEGAGGDAAYRFADQGPLARVIDQVADAYRQRKTRVVALIFAEDRSDAQSFAEAFRVRRHD